MTPPELGFLMLSSHLGDPSRDVLTVSQLRRLSQAMKSAQTADPDRPLREDDLMRAGFDMVFSQRVLKLLDSEEMLMDYLSEADEYDCVPLTWAGQNYPHVLRRKLSDDAPGCIWARGNTGLLEKPMLSLVGSRELSPLNGRFAHELGRQAALQGFALVSGDARGADRTAQEGALCAGGAVIAVVADDLRSHGPSENTLFLSEEDFDARFLSCRALSRNRIIHALPMATFVAQTDLHTGGTWSGSIRNLKSGYSDLFVFDDGSPGAMALCDLGAKPCTFADLQDLRNLFASGHCL